MPELIEIICPIVIPEDSTRPSTIDTVSNKSNNDGNQKQEPYDFENYNLN